MTLEELRKFIPNKVKISGIDYVVELRADRSRDDGVGHSGSCNEWYSKIWLSYQDRNFDSIMQDFVHEIIEAINGCYNLNLNHQTITTLATALHQVLSDNDLHFT